MGITYREGNDGRLSVQQMDDNFRYLEEQLSGLTNSVSGTSGTSGQNGATGPSGTSGTSGTSGINGTSGTSGQNGATGPQGATGPAGEFDVTGGISFPFLPGNQRTGSGDNLQFEKGSVYQKIISTQDGTESVPTVERLVISGGDSYQNGPTYSGEGGDIYLWAGKGQNGGDIKVDAGDGISSGGTVKVRGGYTETGNGGFVEISAGYSNDGTGGDVIVSAGNGNSIGNTGGNVNISSGYGNNTGGNISLIAGNGGTAGGNLTISTSEGTWTFKNDGSIRFPDNSEQTTAYPGLINFISSGITAPGSSVVASETNVNINFSDGGGTWSFGATAVSFPDNTVQTTAYTPKYKVYTALLTQSGNRGDVVGIDSGELEIGVTYYINQNSNGDFTNVGAPNNTNGTYFVATGTTPNDWGIGIVGGDKLTFVPDAPVTTVLENTIGNVWWIYNANRQFSAKSNNLFTEDKTILFIQGSNDGDTSSSTILNNLYWIDTHTINCILSDGNLSKTSVEIRVYN